MANGLSQLGKHLLVEFMDCDSNVLNNPERIEQYMKEAAEACGATIVQSCFHLFNPFGVSGVVVIAESHLAIHTWPEFGYAAIDLFTCGDTCRPEVAYDYLKQKLGSRSAIYTEVARGLMDPNTNSFHNTPFKLQFMKEEGDVVGEEVSTPIRSQHADSHQVVAAGVSPQPQPVQGGR